MHVAGYERLKRLLNLEAPNIITDRMMQCVQVDERILERFDVDTRGVQPFAPDGHPDVELDEVTYRDEWGVVRYKPEGSYWYDLRSSPLAGEISIQDILAYPWPDPDDPGRTRGLRQRALELREKDEYALVLFVTAGITHISQYLRGFQDWYMDMAADQALIAALMDAILEITMAIARNALLKVGDLVDIVFTGDDLGTQTGPQLSPATFRKLLKPRYARFFGQIHELCPHAKVALHSCGSIYLILNDLIDAGVQVLNPIQVHADNMRAADLKREFGDRLCFWGAIDTQQVLPNGSVEEVKAEVRRRMFELGPGGGYVLSAVHNIQPDVPTDNVLTMLDYAREAGLYPLSGGR